MSDWKRGYNREIRRAARQLANASWRDPDLHFPTVDDVANPWSGPRDGWAIYMPFRDGDRMKWYRWVLMK